MKRFDMTVAPAGTATTRLAHTAPRAVWITVAGARALRRQHARLQAVLPCAPLVRVGFWPAQAGFTVTTLAADSHVGPDSQNPVTDTDVELVTRTAAGDRAAFEQLYARYAAWVNGVAFVATRSAESAEEVTQEVFVRVWRYARGFDATRGRVEAWLFAIIRNRVRDRMRLAGRAASLHGELDDELPDPIDHRPEHALSDGQAKQAVRAALDLLPAEQRQVVELCFFEGLTHREAADRLGLALGTLKGRVRLAMDKLRSRLQEDA